MKKKLLCLTRVYADNNSEFVSIKEAFDGSYCMTHKDVEDHLVCLLSDAVGENPSFESPNFSSKNLKNGEKFILLVPTHRRSGQNIVHVGNTPGFVMSTLSLEKASKAVPRSLEEVIVP